MAEWHLPPDYIVEHWTEEMLQLMVDKLVERKEREARPSVEPATSEVAFFRQAGVRYMRKADVN